MPKYHVEIEEEITEIHCFMVEASDHKEAAKIASRKWLNEGEVDPQCGVQQSVNERSYCVVGDDGEDEKTFSAEIEDE